MIIFWSSILIDVVSQNLTLLLSLWLSLMYASINIVECEYFYCKSNIEFKCPARKKNARKSDFVRKNKFWFNYLFWF